MSETDLYLREILHGYLTDNCTCIEQWYQPFFSWDGAAQALGVDDIGDLPKPYGVIVINPDRGTNIDIARRHVIEIWPYFEPGNFMPLDEAVLEIRKILTGSLTYDSRNFHVSFEGTGRDYHDENLRAITRTIDFSLPFLIGG